MEQAFHHLVADIPCDSLVGAGPRLPWPSPCPLTLRPLAGLPFHRALPLVPIVAVPGPPPVLVARGGSAVSVPTIISRWNAIKSWTSSASQALSTSPRSNPKPTAISRYPRKDSRRNWACSRSANCANTPRKNWAPSLTPAVSMTRCSTAELCPSICSKPAPTHGSQNKSK